MKQNKNLEQRTFLQDRFDILIKKQIEGTASFVELTELDDIVNKHATIREKILEVMQNSALQPNEHTGHEHTSYIPKSHPTRILSKMKSFFGRLFIIKITIPSSPLFPEPSLHFIS